MTGPIDFGDLRRLTPIDPLFGGGRGKPIDRHYIERFLAANAGDVRGRVLEVADSGYTTRYGGCRVAVADVLHIDPGHPGATVIGNLGDTTTFPADTHDCFICTQTLQYVHALDRAVDAIHQCLKPGGVLLLTVPGISQISVYDRERWGEHWRFTPQSVDRLLQRRFGSAVQVAGYGNVLATCGFLYGLCCDDLTLTELDHQDDRYPLLVTARAVKAPDAA